MDTKFTQSRADQTSEITKALREVLWGVSWLEKLDKCATSSLAIMQEAMELVEARLSKVRIHNDNHASHGLLAINQSACREMYIGMKR